MADVELSGLAIRGEVLDGVSVFGGSLRGSDIAVQGSRGFGLYASNGADTVFERVVLVGGDADWSALAAFDGSLEVRDVAVSHRPGSTSSAQRLTHSVADATLRISRAWISGAGPLSTLVDSSSTMEVTDAVLAGDGDATPGTTGALVFGGGRFALERVRVERAAAGPIFAGDPGTILELTDVAFRDVYGTAEIDGFGRAIDVETGAHCNLSRVLVERATETALLFTGAGATGTLADLTVRDTLPGEGGAEGRALQVQLEAIVSVARFRSTRQREVALIAAGAGARMELFDVVIEETLPRACCPGFGAGIGAGSYLDAQLRIERFSIRDNALAGVQIARNGGMDLSQGEIRNNPVGANVQVPGYEFTRLSDRVSYRENGINLDAEELPVPDP
jgi:hypothetical protein